MPDTLDLINQKLQEWKEKLARIEATIHAVEAAGVPTLAVWNRYYQIAAAVQRMEKTLKELQQG